MDISKGVHQLPDKLLITNGAVDMRKIAYIQKIQSREGSKEHNLYNQYWEDLMKDQLDETGQTKQTLNKRLMNEEGNIDNKSHGIFEEEVNLNDTEGFNNNNNNITQEESDEVWVGIILSDGDTHYQIQDIYGGSLTKVDVVKIKSDPIKYEDFSLKCWSGYLGIEMYSQEGLKSVLADILDVDLSEVKDTRVDMEYEETVGIVVSFHALVERGGL